MGRMTPSSTLRKCIQNLLWEHGSDDHLLDPLENISIYKITAFSLDPGPLSGCPSLSNFVIDPYMILYNLTKNVRALRPISDQAPARKPIKGGTHS